MKKFQFNQKIHLTFLEGIMAGFMILGIWLVLHYDLGFDFQGKGNGFRLFTLFDICLFAIIMYRYLTKFNVIETFCYTVFQYIYFDTIWAFSNFVSLNSYMAYITVSHYVLMYIIASVLIIYYYGFRKPHSFSFIRLPLYLLATIPFIYVAIHLGYSTGTYLANPDVIWNTPISYVLVWGDEIFKWIMLPAFWYSKIDRMNEKNRATMLNTETIESQNSDARLETQNRFYTDSPCR